MKPIIIREFLEHIKSMQFYILLIFSTILFSVSGWVAVTDYQEHMSNYNKNVSNVLKNPSTMATSCYRKPNPLLFIASGGIKLEPGSVMLFPKGNIMEGVAGEGNFRMPNVPELDWAFIIKIVFSLYVILLSFHSISGEKENGTLRIIVANSIERSKIVLGKYVSILLTLLIPLAIGVLLSLVIVSLYVPHILNLGVLSRLLFMLLLAFGYLSLFIFLGLLFSSLIHRSSLALLVLLAAWITFVFIIPNVSGILADRFTKIPSEYETAQQVGPLMQQEVWGRINAIREGVERGEFETKEQILEQSDQAFEEAQSRVRQYYANFDNAMEQRASTARNISRLSPSALFQYAAESITESGPLRQQHFFEDVKEYSAIYDAYVLDKLGKVVGTSRWSFGTDMMFKGEYLYISSPRPQEYDGDKTDFPFFEESPPDLLRNVRDALFDIAVLLLWNALLALLAFKAVSRCDVR